MLGDNDLERSARKLEDFKHASTAQQEKLSEVLESYASLIESHARLTSDFEGARDAREKYKQMARGQERNPFVLVLIDGDGYIFEDDLVGDGIDGGQRAAQLLNEAVSTSLR